MVEPTDDVIKLCREHLDRYFAQYGNPTQKKNALKALRFLVAGDEPMRGAPEGWAAGIIYGLANRYRRACGAPDMLNADFEAFFGVSMSTIRKRAAQENRALDF